MFGVSKGRGLGKGGLDIHPAGRGEDDGKRFEAMDVVVASILRKQG